MRMPTAAEWERIHSLSDALEELEGEEMRERLEELRAGEDPIIYSCLRAHLLIPEPAIVAELAPGTLLAGKYEVRECIGRGGMGVVYRAAHRHTGRDIALKAIRPRMVSPQLRERFGREVANLAKLRHPSIVRLFDADLFTDAVGAEQLFYTMELVDGVGLDVWLRESAAPLEARLMLLEKLCRGVHAAHVEGIVHRDLKPQNILVDRRSDLPIILDFGLARLRGEMLAVGAEDGAADGEVAPLISLLSGTPAYMDPELPAHGNSDEAADLYALGVIAFEVLSGHLPFELPERPTLHQVREAVARGRRYDLRDFVPSAPASLDAVLKQAQRRRARDRYADVGKFADALLDQATRGRRLRRRTLVSVTFAGLATVSLLAAGTAWHEWGESERRRAQAERAERAGDVLVDFLLDDLRGRLEPTGRLDLMEPVVEQAVAHYEQRVRDQAGNRGARLALAAALQTKGEVLGVRGEAVRAEQALRAAVDHTAVVRDADRASAAAHLAVARAQRKLGDHLMRREQYTAALIAYTDGAAAVAEALRLEPSRLEVRVAAAASQRQLGDAYSYHLDRLDAAMAAYTASRDLYDAILAERPGEAQIREQRALLETSIGSLHETLGDFPAMVAHFRTYHDHVVRTHGAGTVSFAHSAFRMGVAMVKTGEFREAVGFLEPATEIAQANVAQHPGETESLKLLSSCLRFFAEAQAGLGEAAAAADLARREGAVNAALDRLLDADSVGEDGRLTAEMERLYHHSGDDEEWSRFVHQVRLAVEAEHAGDPEAQISVFRGWLANVEALSAGEAAWHAQLALAAASFHNRIGDAGLAAGRPAEAAEAFDAAYALRHARWAQDRGSTRTQLDLISNAGHRVGARLAASQDVEFLSAARDFLAAAEALSDPALASKGLWHAERFAGMAETARMSWPQHSAEIQGLCAGVAAALVDRSPDGGGELAGGLRERLVWRLLP